jgi:hypothetical protein
MRRKNVTQKYNLIKKSSFQNENSKTYITRSTGSAATDIRCSDLCAIRTIRTQSTGGYTCSCTIPANCALCTTSVVRGARDNGVVTFDAPDAERHSSRVGVGATKTVRTLAVVCELAQHARSARAKCGGTSDRCGFPARTVGADREAGYRPIYTVGTNGAGAQSRAAAKFP